MSLSEFSYSKPSFLKLLLFSIGRLNTYQEAVVKRTMKALSRKKWDERKARRSDAQDRPDGFVELVIQEIDRMGHSLGRDEGVITKDHICRFSFMRKRQTQPK